MSSPDGPPLVPPTPQPTPTPTVPSGQLYGAPAWNQPSAAYSGWAQPQPIGEPEGQAALRKLSLIHI